METEINTTVPEAEISDNGTEESATRAPISEEKPVSEETPDYEELLKSDMKELARDLFDSEEIEITDLKDPIRYGALRDLGLTPKEAFLASGGRVQKADNRSHLSSSVPRNMSSPFSEIPRDHLEMARELFGEMSDGEIRSLYRKVTQ